MDDKLYQILADNALYDFLHSEGRNAGNLMCELIPNIDPKLVRNKKLNETLLQRAIKTKLIAIINSKLFTKSLKSYCKEECNALMEIK